MNPPVPIRVFISHSSHDKYFVRELVAELKDKKVAVWFDELELKPGDSIVQGISDGLRDTDYLFVVLSPHSVASKWVAAELNAAMMRQFSDGGTIVVPLMKEDCVIPPLLADRKYVDFRTGFKQAVAQILELLQLEDKTAAFSARTGAKPKPGKSHSCKVSTADCIDKLRGVGNGDLRRIVFARLTVDEIRATWFDTFGTDMYDQSRAKTRLDWSVDLVHNAKRQKMESDLRRELCKNYWDKLCKGLETEST